MIKLEQHSLALKKTRYLSALLLVALMVSFAAVSVKGWPVWLFALGFTVLVVSVTSRLQSWMNTRACTQFSKTCFLRPDAQARVLHTAAEMEVTRRLCKKL